MFCWEERVEKSLEAKIRKKFWSENTTEKFGHHVAQMHDGSSFRNVQVNSVPCAMETLSICIYVHTYILLHNICYYKEAMDLWPLHIRFVTKRNRSFIRARAHAHTSPQLTQKSLWDEKWKNVTKQTISTHYQANSYSNLFCCNLLSVIFIVKQF